jgi:hypothetical protein
MTPPKKKDIDLTIVNSGSITPTQDEINLGEPRGFSQEGKQGHEDIVKA